MMMLPTSSSANKLTLLLCPPLLLLGADLGLIPDEDPEKPGLPAEPKSGWGKWAWKLM